MLLVNGMAIGEIIHPEDIVFGDDSIDKIYDGIRVPQEQYSKIFELPDFSPAPSDYSVSAEFLDILFAKHKRLPRKLKKAYKRVQSYILCFSIDVLDNGSRVEPEFNHPTKGRLEAKAKRLMIAEYGKTLYQLK